MGSLVVTAFSANNFAEMKNPAMQKCMLSEMVQFVAAGMRSLPAVPATERPSLPTLLFPPQK